MERGRVFWPRQNSLFTTLPTRLWPKLIALRGGPVPLNEKTPTGSLAEPKFVCSACGKRGADVRPDFDWEARRAYKGFLIGKEIKPAIRDGLQSTQMERRPKPCWHKPQGCTSR
jgi:hypothetical protein